MERYDIINNYSKADFSNFLNSDNSGKVLELFNDEGINIIQKSYLKEERINYILAFSPYKNELLQEKNFLDMFLNTNISSYYANLGELSFKTYDTIFKRCIDLNKNSDLIALLFSYFNKEYKLDIIENWVHSEELLYAIFKIDQTEVVQKIIDSHNIDLSSHNINLKSFFANAKESVLKSQAKRNLNNEIVCSINVPSSMIDKKLAEKLFNEYDIFAVRAIINDAYYCSDASFLNEYVKQKEQELINSYNDDKLFFPFDKIYDSYKKYKLEEEKIKKDKSYDEDAYFNYKREFLSVIRSLGDENILSELNLKYEENGLHSAFLYLKVLSDRCLSNYIIDYHFEENFHNVIIDVRELLHFYYDGNITLNEERTELYNKISNIDYLSYEEKIELHNYMKNINMIEIFYDDMLFARRIIAESIKEYSLSFETIKKYKDEKLSKKYGVDVYKLNGDSFFGIVKTGNHGSDYLPSGHSYSLVGAGGLATFGDQKDSNTYLYDSDSMKPEQLVHAFPYDSFTYYHPFESSFDATKRVNTFAMPDELVRTSKNSYNELLILEQGKIKTDIDASIPKLKRIALYCLDEINEKDINAAKDNDVGIILVSSSDYKDKEDEKLYKYRKGINEWEYNYFDGSYEKDKFESKR